MSKGLQTHRNQREESEGPTRIQNDVSFSRQDQRAVQTLSSPWFEDHQVFQPCPGFPSTERERCPHNLGSSYTPAPMSTPADYAVEMVRCCLFAFAFLHALPLMQPHH
ncbi:hypothetical protein NX059_011767 [Plenodomus lindquistii]|nr:hypothetical protein NX059_011767 [Plenodomus lindquistii]